MPDPDKADWQPIATAPKQRIVLLFAVTDRAPDGTVLNWKMATGDWHHAYDSDRVEWTWDGRELKAYDHQPTHWMPLPEPPEDAHA